MSAHRAGTRPFDLGLQNAGAAELLADAEMFVLVCRELSGIETEPAPQPDVHRIGLGRPVERQRCVSAPIDDHRLASLVADVASADVERTVEVITRCSVVVEPTEEQRNAGVVLQRLHPAMQHLLEVLGGDVGTFADRGGADSSQPGSMIMHPLQLGAGPGQVIAFAGERFVGIGWVCRHAGALRYRSDGRRNGSAQTLHRRRQMMQQPPPRAHSYMSHRYLLEMFTRT